MTAKKVGELFGVPMYESDTLPTDDALPTDAFCVVGAGVAHTPRRQEHHVYDGEIVVIAAADVRGGLIGDVRLAVATDPNAPTKMRLMPQIAAACREAGGLAWGVWRAGVAAGRWP